MHPDRDTIYDAIRQYVQENFLDDSDVTELAPDTPLLEWGVLTSMNTSLLLAFIRTELDVVVPPTHITGRHFASLDAVTDLVYGLAPQSA
ncbi:acyl carrier protein [Streptomyces armeniacus]|uniref:Acyl carrier protein n=1 Tax=Streptomyces armeniacus TaxID=83291 RepID=A0A345XUY1_9ACTN|nr:acyl carrier protein [Streptomyces armeniacus]AWS21292.1 proline carrier protein [Streptomyces armeniacus]AXK35447.1 acyl carrier protein [Streptomyces armeniacus]AZY92021.1 putative proline carrier protein [Streptomyces armeniacus]